MFIYKRVNHLICIYFKHFFRLSLIHVCIYSLKTKSSSFFYPGYASKCHRPEDVVVLVYAVEMSEIFTSAQWLQTPNTEDIDAFQTIFRHEIEKIQKKLQTFTKVLRQLEINGSVRSTHACKPGEGIINVAKELNAAMIVTGSRGHGKLRRTLLGSVSDYLIHHADIPVLVCRHQSFK